MRKYSRQHGWMILRTYAPGDGRISFNWVGEQSPMGEALNEHVTESDISMWLREPENKHFSDWEILNITVWAKAFIPQYCLCQKVTRPFHTSKKLRLDGTAYEYDCHEYDCHGESHECHHNSGNTTFYRITKTGRRSMKQVCNVEIILAMMFFLNNEATIGENGIETRER